MKKIFITIILFASFAMLFSCQGKKEETDEERKERLMKEVQEEAKPAYIQAFTEVQTIKNYISIAEQGTMPKSDVVRYFNETFGSHMGRLNSFDKVKARIEEAGEGYIQFKFKKECSRIANERAGELDFELNKNK